MPWFHWTKKSYFEHCREVWTVKNIFNDIIIIVYFFWWPFKSCPLLACLSIKQICAVPLLRSLASNGSTVAEHLLHKLKVGGSCPATTGTESENGKGPHESSSPTNKRNVQKGECKVNCSKDALLFHQHLCSNLTAYFSIQLLHWTPHFGAMLPNVIVIKSMKSCLCKSRSVLLPKMLVKLTPGKLFTPKLGLV